MTQQPNTTRWNRWQTEVMFYGGPLDGVKIPIRDAGNVIIHTPSNMAGSSEYEVINTVTYERVHMHKCGCIAYVFDVTKAVQHKCEATN